MPFGSRIKNLFGQKIKSPGTEKFLEEISDKMYDLEQEEIVKQINDFNEFYEFELTNGDTVTVEVSVK